FSPWELELLNLKNSLLKKEGYSYNLDEAMKTEMGGVYKLFTVRSMLNQCWARMTLRKNLKGALMYIVAQRCI
ncbi:MAG: hypothetical protein ACRESZ_00880, partial [Methylococcales bacterium]